MKRNLIAANAAATLPLLLALVALLVWGGREVERPWGIHEGTGSPWTSSVVEGWVDQMVAEQVTALGCDTKVRLSPELAVRNAGRVADGTFDTGVVRKVSFDEGFALADGGKVWVVGWCG